MTDIEHEPTIHAAPSASAFPAPLDARRAASSPYESLDYEIYETAAYRHRQTTWTSREHMSYTALKWILCLILGTFLALVSFLVNLGVENISIIKYRAASAALLLPSGGALISLTLLLAVNSALILLATAVTVYFAPDASGSGISEVKAFLNGVNIPGLHTISSLLAKVVGVTFVVSAGLPLGKEGPFVHIGAASAALLADGGPFAHLLGTAFRSFKNDRDRRDLVTAGTAAGVAGAFRSPIGGLLFALEEMTTTAAWRPHLLWRCFFTCAVVVFLARPLTRICENGGCGFSARGQFIIYEITNPQSDFYLAELLPLLVIGVVGGLLGAAFIRVNTAINHWRHTVLYPALTFQPAAGRGGGGRGGRKAPRSDGGRVGKVAEALLATTFITVASFLLAYMSPCSPCPPEAAEGACPAAEGRYVQMACPAGSYNDLGTLLFNTQDEAIRALFSSGTENHFRYRSLLIFFVYYFATFSATFGMAFPAGSLVPSIIAGAAFGRAVGRFAVRREALEGLGPGIDASTFSVLGSAALLAGVLRSTASLCVILLEVTSHLSLLPMLMLVVVVAKCVADLTGTEGFFETTLAAKGLAFLEHAPPRSFRHFTAADVASPDPVTLPKIAQVREILSTLESNRHNAFPVVCNRSGLVLGLVLRSDLIRVLAMGRALQNSDGFEAGPVQEAYAEEIALGSGGPGGSGTGLSSGGDGDLSTSPTAAAIESELSLEQVRSRLSETPESDARQASLLGKYLNLSPYLNPAPFVVQEETSLTKTYQLFTKLNLRHLLVVPRIERVTGIITRHDLYRRPGPGPVPATVPLQPIGSHAQAQGGGG